MRGADTFTESLFTMRKLEDFVPAKHPLREIRKTANAALEKLGPVLTAMYAADVKGGRPGIAPEKVPSTLKCSPESRSRCCAMTTTSLKNSLIQAWAGHKSFVLKDEDQGDGGGDNSTNCDDSTTSGNFKGQRRSNDTHESKTDGDARLYRKGNTASELRYMGHTLSDNRHGLIANAMVTQADGFAEREAAKVMIKDARQALGDDEREVTLGADKGYDAKEFIEACVAMNVTPHVAQNTSGRKSAVPDEIAQAEGYAISQRKRKLIEQGLPGALTASPCNPKVEPLQHSITTAVKSPRCRPAPTHRTRSTGAEAGGDTAQEPARHVMAAKGAYLGLLLISIQK